MDFQCLLGLKCNDFAMIAADQTNILSGMYVMDHDHVKLHKITDKLVLGVMGDQGDTAQFVQYITKNVQLYRMRHNYPLDTNAVVHMTKRNLAEAWTKASPFAVNFLFAGYDDTDGSQLYFLDSFGASIKLPYSMGLGLAGMIGSSIMDQWHRPELTITEAYNILQMCTQEIHQRFVVQLPKFQVSVVSKDGIQDLPPIVNGRE